MNKKTNYGNWVSKTMLHTFYLLTAVFILLTGLFFSGLTASWSPALTLGLRVIFVLFTVVLAVAAVYFTICHNLFSYDGKEKLQERIVNYVVAHLELPEGGRTLLDIGCGSGVISIKAAKKFPDAAVTGVDYWGKGWDYAKQQCERNAELEGVKERITFQNGDAGNLNFPDAAFDGAISNFVFHEVRTQPDKRQVVKEALRVIKKGGSFSFHDLFLDRSLYGNIDDMLEELRREGITQIQFIPTAEALKVPKILRTKMMIGNIGLLYGVK